MNPVQAEFRPDPNPGRSDSHPIKPHRRTLLHAVALAGDQAGATKLGKEKRREAKRKRATS